MLSSGPEKAQEGLGEDMKPEFGGKRPGGLGLGFGRSLSPGFLMELKEGDPSADHETSTVYPNSKMSKGQMNSRRAVEQCDRKKKGMSPHVYR